MKKCRLKQLVLALVLVLLALSMSCVPGDVTETTYFGELHSTNVVDASVEWGTATIVTGGTFVVVNHTLGVAPSLVLLTLANIPSSVVSYSVKNPQPTQFGIEISGALASDLHFYWEAKR